VFLADEMDVAACRMFCEVCPVRSECGEQAMTEEGNTDIANRFFVRGWLTPAQRISIQRRGGLKGRDPMHLAQGWDVDRQVPPVPDEGDRWSKHHTTLARKLVRYLDSNRIKGSWIPNRGDLCTVLECNPAPLERVLDALVQDGTLDIVTDGWYVYRGGANVVGSWLPIHLRDLERLPSE
jgi:hypothetical protein